MSDIDRSAILLFTMDALREVGSWCGETHVQKTTYICQEIMNVPSCFKFVLYKHGPYSFELNQELQELILDDLVHIQTRPPYGPTLDVSEEARVLSKKVANIDEISKCITFISEKIGRKNVGELEKLATAVFINHKKGTNTSIDDRINALVTAKPHIDVESARKAFLEVVSIESEAAQMKTFGSLAC